MNMREEKKAAYADDVGPSWEALHHAWMKIGADVAGLDWGAFTNAVHYAPTAQAALLEALKEAQAGLEFAAARLPHTTGFVPSHIAALNIVNAALAAAPTTQAAPQQEAREPVDSMGTPLSCGKPLCSPGNHNPLCKRAAPQPAPVAQGDAEDAERYRWLRRWKGQEHEPPFTVQHEMDGTMWGDDLDAAIDAARAQAKEGGA